MGNKTIYYDFREDSEKYPDAWCYIAIGGRNTGKTYSTLKYIHEEDQTEVFVKRTKQDVKLLCTKDKSNIMDFSPYKPLNRDLGWSIYPSIIDSDAGIGGFYDTDKDGNNLDLIGYVVALSAVTKVKGFSLEDAEWIVFDEFIPQQWERVSRQEGEQVMDLYKTVDRGRTLRGKKPLKIVFLANAVDISSPVTNILEVTDIIAEMKSKGESINYIEERGILIHLLDDNEDFRAEEQKSILYKAMGETSWGEMAFNNAFAYNDFSNVSKINLKNYVPVVSFTYKRNTAYVYRKDGFYYVCGSRAMNIPHYDLNRENGQKAFYYDYVIDLRNECINDKMKFSKYSYYDLIVNYKEFFKL